MTNTISKKELQRKFPNRDIGKVITVSIVEKLMPNYYLEIKGYAITSQDDYCLVTRVVEEPDNITDEKWAIIKVKTWSEYQKDCEKVNTEIYPHQNYYKQRKLEKIRKQIDEINMRTTYFAPDQSQIDSLEWLQYTYEKWENAQWVEEAWRIEPMTFINFKQWQVDNAVGL